jgi:hypothetical protein
MSAGASFHIPWTKTTKEDGATITLTACNDHLCPIKALTFHFSMNHQIPDNAPLFAFMSTSGYSLPTKSFFLSTCSSIWEAAGLPPVQGHSFRIGGASELLTAGVSPEVVACLGGWTSLAFLLYWRKVEHILPMNITDAYKKKRVQELAAEMECFRICNSIPNSAALDHDD